MEEKKTNCWEFKKCPPETHEHCPAYPDRGQDCWKITGTRCEKGLIEKKSLSEKVEYCRTCEYFKAFAHKF